MGDELTATSLHSLLVASLAASCLLILISTAIVGRKLADRDYQRARGINGTMVIQGTVNLRTHCMRVLVGVTFGLIAILLLADAPMIWRQWVNRILFVVLPGGYVVSSVLDWWAEREQMRIEIDQEAAIEAVRVRTAADVEHERTASLRADRDSHKEMAAEAIAALVVAVDRLHDAQGDTQAARVPPLAAVIPEHSSPVTPEQQDEADRQTLRAKLTAAALELGLPPRETGEAEPAPSHERESVDVATIQPQAVADIATAVHQADKDAAR